MIEKLEIYNKINSKNYLRFELNESNEKEYLNKLISVKDALIEVERKNNEEYNNKITKLDSAKVEVKDFYDYIQDAKDAATELKQDFENYTNDYINPLQQLSNRKEKLQMQVVPYITNGFWQKFKAIFSYEGRAKLTIERQFNKELKSVEKEINELQNLKNKNPLTFENRDEEIYKNILDNIDLDLINGASELTEKQINEFQLSLEVAKDIAIKTKRMNLINNISEYIEICSDYSFITDLNFAEHYKFKSTEYKIYLQEGYLDNDYNSISKYLETAKTENDFVGKQAANKLIDGIEECIEELGKIVNDNNDESLKLA